MTYTVNDITELIRYHLVAAAPDDESADRNLIQVTKSIDQLRTTPNVDESFYWTVCEECGAWVSSELIGPDGAGTSENGGFYCTSCRFTDDEP